MSIGVAFSLSRAGASAGTAAVLDEIFAFPAAGSHSAANAVDLLLAGVSSDPNTVEVANRLFPDDGFSPRPEFLGRQPDGSRRGLDTGGNVGSAEGRIDFELPAHAAAVGNAEGNVVGGGAVERVEDEFSSAGAAMPERPM